jgi:cytochrome c biogenesis protein CcmG/thiol:disulfide interchange protein DsbE
VKGVPVKKKAPIIILLVILLTAIAIFVERARGPFTRPIQQGDPAPDFTLPGLDDRDHTLSSERGKIVILNFWATWCPPCREEMPSLNRLASRLNEDDFRVLAVSVDEDNLMLKKTVEEMKLSLTILLDPRRKAARLYGVDRFPETFIVNRQGIVAARVVGAADWMAPGILDGLQEIAAETPPGTPEAGTPEAAPTGTPGGVQAEL